MSWTIIETASFNPLEESQIQGNADEMCLYFISKNKWTNEAVAGMLGNLEVESYLNPAQYEAGYDYSLSHGFGLAQWTPATKYQNWAAEHGYTNNDPNGQMLWLNTMPNGEWFKSTDNYLPFDEFKMSKLDPSYLARVWSDSFERPLNYDNRKSEQAEYWYNYITGKTFNKKFPIYFYLKRR